MKWFCDGCPRDEEPQPSCVRHLDGVPVLVYNCPDCGQRGYDPLAVVEQ